MRSKSWLRYGIAKRNSIPYFEQYVGLLISLKFVEHRIGCIFLASDRQLWQALLGVFVDRSSGEEGSALLAVL